jgi:hypothetical protein
VLTCLKKAHQKLGVDAHIGFQVEVIIDVLLGTIF